MADPNRLIGHKVDKYIVKQHIKRGGMADVFLAYDEGLDRKIALKIALPQFTSDPAFVERFRREAKAAARLRHPNIVQVYATGVTPDGDNYIAMEYVQGGTLTEMLQQLEQRGEVLSVTHILTIVRRVADALNMAHLAGIVHRDLKPSNILMRPDGTPVLTDLGIAVIKDDPRLTRTHALMGTPNYMAPEQASGGAVDGRSDIYALGVILYELLAGARPFVGDTPWAVLHMHMHEQPTPIHQIRRDISPETETVVHTCLQKDPNRRYQSAEQLVMALDQALMAEGATSYMGVAQPHISRETVIMQTPTAFAPDPFTPQPTPTPMAATPSYVPMPAAPPQKRRLWVPVLVVVLLLLIPGGYFGGRALMNGRNEATPPPQTALVDNGQENEETAVAAIDATSTLQPTQTNTATATATATNAPTATATGTATPTATPTHTTTPTPSATPAPSATTTATPTPTVATGLSSGGGLPYGFEDFGVWVRGDEANGVFARSNAQAHSGSYSGRLSYDFGTTGNDYVVFLQTNSISGSPNALRVWVYGDSSAHFLNAWILDANGQTWQVPFGQIFHSGWAQMTGYIDVDQAWPWTHISGTDNGRVDYPISFRGFVLDDYNSSYTGSGVVYIDDLVAATVDETGNNTPTSPTATPGGGAATPAPTAVPAPGGDSGRILYTAGDQLMTTDPAWSAPQSLGTFTSDSCSSPATTTAGDSYNIYYGPRCAIPENGFATCNSPNGAWTLVINGRPDNIQILIRTSSQDDSQARLLLEGLPSRSDGIRWSPNSDFFIIVDGGSIKRATTNSGFVEIAFGNPYSPVISQDGSQILFFKGNDLFVVSSGGGVDTNVTNGATSGNRCAAWRN